MEWLNYHHLFYFSVIVREGGVAAAARKLRLTHSTLSAQLRALEEHFGVPLFERRGRRLVLTPFGGKAATYAEDIFRLGRELNDVARGDSSPRRDILRVGVVSGIPKTLVYHLLSPALESLADGVVLVHQDKVQNLFESLSLGRTHVVLTNELPSRPPGSRIRIHALGETELLWYGRAKLARSARRTFPKSLGSVPLVLPPSGTALRKRLDEWFLGHGIEVTVRAEIDDAGLLRAFGQEGRGLFPVRAALRAEVEDLSRVELVGKCEGVREPYYALTIERWIKHSALVALVEHARSALYEPGRNTRPAKRDP